MDLTIPRVLMWQVVVGAVLAAVLGVVFDWVVGYSALLGSLTSVIPNAVVTIATVCGRSALRLFMLNWPLVTLVPPSGCNSPRVDSILSGFTVHSQTCSILLVCRRIDNSRSISSPCIRNHHDFMGRGDYPLVQPPTGRTRVICVWIPST